MFGYEALISPRVKTASNDMMFKSLSNWILIILPILLILRVKKRKMFLLQKEEERNHQQINLQVPSTIKQNSRKSVNLGKHNSVMTKVVAKNQATFLVVAHAILYITLLLKLVKHILKLQGLILKIFV